MADENDDVGIVYFHLQSVVRIFIYEICIYMTLRCLLYQLFISR